MCDGKKMLYVHGFASSGSSGTVMTLRSHFRDWRVVAPDLPVDPFEALELLRETVRKEQPRVVVGTSMGGMYTQQLIDDATLFRQAFLVARQ